MADRITSQTLILIQCQDAVGLVSRLSHVLAAHELNIISMREYVDEDSARFFSRIVCTGSLPDADSLMQELVAILPAGANVKVHPPKRRKLAVLVTKDPHCLGDTLVKHFFDTLGADVCCVIGNYAYLRAFTERFDVPFHYVSHDNCLKEDFESGILQILSRYNPDYIVLSKFMRILSPAFVGRYIGRIINMHHSFLPAFMGANPYRQAHVRGVKLIGATAHFVTNDLDDGPIIAQDIRRVDHSYTVDDMKRAGIEVEKTVLSKALSLIIEDRVFIIGNRTVVFD